MSRSPMSHPDESARRSYSPSGVIADQPAEIERVTVEDEDDNPVGLLERWSATEWIYAEFDSFQEL